MVCRSRQCMIIIICQFYEYTANKYVLTADNCHDRQKFRTITSKCRKPSEPNTLIGSVHCIKKSKLPCVNTMNQTSNVSKYINANLFNKRTRLIPIVNRTKTRIVYFIIIIIIIINFIRS